MTNGDHDTRLTVLETSIREWKKAHDVRSNEIWDYIKEELIAIKTMVKCEVHAERIKQMNGKINWLYVVIAGVLGVAIRHLFQ